MNTGVPTTAVRMPGGTSMTASVREIVSIATMNIAPNITATGNRRENSGPTTSRAM